MDKGFFYCRFFYCRVFPVWKMRINGAFMQGSLNDEFFLGSNNTNVGDFEGFPLYNNDSCYGGWIYVHLREKTVMSLPTLVSNHWLEEDYTMNHGFLPTIRSK